MFRLGQQAIPAKVLRMPNFPHLRENNVRTGLLEDSQFRKLVEGSELWFRALAECGRIYGWRVSELLNMSVSQVDLAQRTIRLEPGTTKNSDGREVVMTHAVFTLLSACVLGKPANAHGIHSRQRKNCAGLPRDVGTSPLARRGTSHTFCQVFGAHEYGESLPEMQEQAVLILGPNFP